ncbi:prephenate dehydrogenase/arogenate dehydrogenase family protein [Candidatus Parcubacteria bacterium]|nr:prephenate dehydrogenase/arogenate dehydrogenase family protein [Candidatus Parcubacteria bacterium]
MQKDKKIKIAIIGYGRFGKLLADILKPFGEIYIISRQKINGAESKQLKKQAIKQINIKNLDNIDWVIPAVPISSLVGVLKKMSPYLKKGSLVMDVCSVKVNPCRWLKKYLPKNVELLGSHPMFGPDSAKSGLSGLSIVLCPIRIKKNNLSKVIKVFKKLKIKIIITTASDHDKQTGNSLALVHFLGRAMAAAGLKDQEIDTLGYRRLLAVNETVNNDTWQLFLDMHRYNPYTDKIRKNFINILNELDQKIKGGKYGGK